VTSSLVLLLQAASCLGYGYLLLRLLRIGKETSLFDVSVWSFALGFGLIGWLLFFVGSLGAYTTTSIWAVLVPGLVGAGWLCFARSLHQRFNPAILIRTNIVVPLVFALVAIGFDVAEALAPPADADSLAYHFALPKLFLQSQQLVFVPRALDGAIPLIIQLTYLPVLALGGEVAMTLWSGLTGIAMVCVYYLFARRFFAPHWALWISVILLTTPAVLFGAGSGQVEVRMALFAGAASLAYLRARDDGLDNYIYVSAIFLGFLIGSKYTGLVFAVPVGLLVLLEVRRAFRLAAFGAIVLVAGFQWYLWNWVNTGDPLFPLFHGILPYADAALWDQAHQLEMAKMLTTEVGLSKSVLNFILYPFLSTISDIAAFEGSRVGFGPLVLVLLPLAVLSAVKFRREIVGSDLVSLLIIVLLSYAVWFFLGPSQRVRHLLPVYPVLVILIAATAVKWAERNHSLAVVKTAFLLVAVIQLSGQGVFSLSHLKYVFSDENREQFFSRNVTGYGYAAWINRNLSRAHRIFVHRRQLIYLINTPVFYGHPADEARIDISSSADDPRRFYHQLRSQGVTHLLTENLKNIDGIGNKGIAMWRDLVALECGKVIARITARTFQSRTLSSGNPRVSSAGVVALTPETCSL
jgi:4-amino-4-deoxy-L-arabinose transferase-like glycosyltransferase